MKLRHTLPIALALLVTLGCATSAQSTPAEEATAPAAAAKKRCKTVVKRINGRRRRVRVCRTVRPAAPSAVVARIDVGAEAWIVTAGGDGSVWSDGPTGVARIDPATNTVSLQTRFEGTASGGAGSIWVTSGRTLRRLDSTTGAVQAEITLPHAGEWALALADAVWVTSPDAKSLIRVDPETNAVVATVPACDVKGYGLTEEDGAIWAACYLDGQVLRIDPAANRVVARIALAYGVHSVASGAGSVWVNNHETGMLSRIDGTTNRVVARVRIGPNPAIAFVDGALWASGDSAVLKIDPATNRIAGRLPVGAGEYYSLAYASGSFWLSTIGRRQVLRLVPTRLARP